MLAQLVVIAGPDQGRTISLAEGQTLTIGRGEGVAARLADPHVSRSHCRLEVDGGCFWLHDAGSSGGRSSMAIGSPGTSSSRAM